MYVQLGNAAGATKQDGMIFFAILHSAPSLFFFCSYFFFNAATIREGSPPPPPPLSFARTENPKSEEGESLWNSGEGGAGATFF